MYQLITHLFLFALIRLALAQTQTTLSYDTNYDNAELSLNDVACSGNLESRNYTTLGSLPTFPFVGGSNTIDNGDSPNCGACYAITYGSTTINVVAVDVSQQGFTVSQEAMDALTNGQAVAFGRVDVTYVEVDPSMCDLQN